MSPVSLVTSGADPDRAGRTAGVAICAQCSVQRDCLPQLLAGVGDSLASQLLAQRRRVPRDDWLVQSDDVFHSLFLVRFGHFKSIQRGPRGAVSVGGFAMTGDLLGMEGIATGRHTCGVVALEDSEVCEVPFELLQELAMRDPTLLGFLHRALSCEIEREQSVMLFRSRMRADQRLAIFLLDLADRYAERGYSSTCFQLRMGREDIGAYLGLTVESVSRQLAELRRAGAIVANNRDLRIVDRTYLNAIAAGAGPHPYSASSTLHHYQAG